MHAQLKPSIKESAVHIKQGRHEQRAITAVKDAQTMPTEEVCARGMWKIDTRKSKSNAAVMVMDASMKHMGQRRNTNNKAVKI